METEAIMLDAAACFVSSNWLRVARVFINALFCSGSFLRMARLETNLLGIRLCASIIFFLAPSKYLCCEKSCLFVVAQEPQSINRGINTSK